eukprot:gene12976-14970_t
MLLARSNNNNCNIKSKDGRTALILVSDAGLFEVAQLLLAVPGVDANAVCQAGDTALSLAKNEEIKSLLVLHKATAVTAIDSTSTNSKKLITSESPSTSTWLTVRLLRGGMLEPLVRHCEQKLVFTEGFSSERDFAECPPAEFTHAYLRSVGITAMGVQVQLIRLQSELHAQYAQQSKVSSSVPAPLPPTPPPSQSTLFSGNAHVKDAQGLVERMEKCSLEAAPALGCSQDTVLVASQLDDPNEDPVYVEPTQQQSK